MLKLTFIGTSASSITVVSNNAILLNCGALQCFLFYFVSKHFALLDFDLQSSLSLTFV